MDTADRPHRTNSGNNTGSSSSSNELFICFTSRLSSSSMKLSSKSILSPGRGREPSQISLSNSLSRRLRSNGSMKGGQASPMFPANGKKRGGAAFENPEPSSPKVTCIGQVRVKTKKQSKKLRARSKRRGEISFRRVDQNNNNNDVVTKEDQGNSNNLRDYNLSSNHHPPQQQQLPEGLPHRNQRWVHFSLTICEAIRAFGAEFNCFLPCRSSCLASEKGKGEKAAGSGHSSSCGAVFARWLVAVQEGEGKGREIELVVGEEKDKDGMSGDDGRRRSYRRHVFEEIEFKDDNFGAVNVEGPDHEDEARVSVCIPPKNALLLMRCRSDPVKMAALANKFLAEAPQTPVVAQPEAQDEEKAAEVEEGTEEEEEEDDDKEDHDGKIAAHEQVSSTKSWELAVPEDQENEGEEGGAAAQNERTQMEEHNEEELMGEKFDTLEATQEERQIQDVGANNEDEGDTGDDLMEGYVQQGDTNNTIAKEEGEEQTQETIEDILDATHSSDSHQGNDEEEKKGQLILEEEEEEEAQALTGGGNDVIEKAVNVEEQGTEQVGLRQEPKPGPEPPEPPAQAQQELLTSPVVQEDTEEKTGPALEQLEVEEGGEAGGEEEGSNGNHGEGQGSGSEYPDEQAAGPKSNKIESEAILPDCLLLMMCEPKLSMEVSKETWVCSTDFIRWLPEHSRPPPPRPPVNNKTKTKTKGPDDTKKRNSIDLKVKPPPPAPAAPNLPQQPHRSSCSYPARPPARAAGTESMSTIIGQKLAGGKGRAYEPLVLTRCKSEPMRSAAKLAPEPCFWKNRKLETATLGVGAAGLGF